MAFGSLQLAEPLVDAMVTLLSENLNANIATFNETISDGYTVEPIAKFYPFVPAIATLQAGFPAVGVQELPTEFVDDTQFAMDAISEYVVVAILTHVDPQSLAMQLRRTLQVIAYTIQLDRALGNAGGTGGIMRNQGGAFSVNFERTEPGPTLGEVDPNAPDLPPRSYISWTGLVLSSRTHQVG